jgi:16S rRNA (uracil1498-N3)-methyltransferase
VRRFRVDPLPPSGVAALGVAASHHLLEVLRAVPGVPVAVFDGHGREAVGELVGVRDGVAMVSLGPARVVAEGAPRWLVLAVLKGPAMSDAIRMATEAGVAGIRPVLCARSVARGERIDRWQRIAEAACQQCGRADVPEFAEVDTFEAGLRAIPADWDRRIAHPGGTRLRGASGPAAIVVGPEGGFTEAEVALAEQLGFARAGIGRHVLRADTAAAVSIALLSAGDDD